MLGVCYFQLEVLSSGSHLGILVTETMVVLQNILREIHSTLNFSHHLKAIQTLWF